MYHCTNTVLVITGSALLSAEGVAELQKLKDSSSVALEETQQHFDAVVEVSKLTQEIGALKEDAVKRDKQLKAQDKQLKAQDKQLKAQDKHLKAQDKRLADLERVTQLFSRDRKKVLHLATEICATLKDDRDCERSGD